MDRPAHVLFIVASNREPGVIGNTEWLTRRAAAALPPTVPQTWLRLNELTIPPFVDRRHTVGVYDPPVGDLELLLRATRDATDVVFVAPLYWYMVPAPLKAYLDHWSAWLRVPGIPFKAEMAQKSLSLVTTSGDFAKTQPMIDALRLCGDFLGMRWGGALWGRGGAPGAVESDEKACREAGVFLAHVLAPPVADGSRHRRAT